MNGPRAAVIGWPVAHSRSPLIHNHWLAAYDLAGSYELAAVVPDDLDGFVEGLGPAGYAGANVTLPHKAAVLPLCAHLSETARDLGAVNTLWFENGALHGDNTDVAGFLGALDDEAPGWDRTCRTVAVLGAGGAARAILHALTARGMGEIRLLNRTFEGAASLAANRTDVVALPWDARHEALVGCDLLVNTTSLGMVGKPPLDLDLSALPAHAIVDDIVYVPLETPLLAAARVKGHRTINGLGMLLHQAAPGFARWFGKTPSVTPDLRARLEADIAARG
jgi:shikimate dehydrogenase